MTTSRIRTGLSFWRRRRPVRQLRPTRRGRRSDSAFGDIASHVIGCEFPLTGEVAPEAACAGSVTVDGAAMSCGDDYAIIDDGKTLQLKGDACIMLTDGDAHEVAADFPCVDIAVG